MSGSFSPKFIRAAVSFNYKGQTHEAGECLINSSGLPGIKWAKFDPRAHLGGRVQAYVRVLAKEPWEFVCDALITSERAAGADASCLGLTFLFKPGDRSRLDVTVAQEGSLPDYIRKFPRIHYMSSIPIFPSRAILRYFYKNEDVSIACDVENVSPTGIQVYTDDARAENLAPNETVRVQLQPRGSWLRVIAVNAQVKRINHAVDPVTGNTFRYFGLSLGTISAEAKISFTDLLRQIVVAAKKAA
jgi:hypothetical protein